MTNQFERLWALGYRRLVPVVPPDAEISEKSTLFGRVGTKQDGRGKTPGRRNRDTGKWSSWDWVPYECDEIDLVRWHEMGAGAGIKTGEQPDGTWLAAIDADTLDKGCAKVICDAVMALGQMPVRIGRFPKAIYLCRVSGPFLYQRVDFNPSTVDGKTVFERVEVLSDRKFFVAEGVHPGTRAPYEWRRPLVPYDQLPIIDAADLTTLLDGLRGVLPGAGKLVTEGSGATVEASANLKGDLETVRKAVRAIPNAGDRFSTRESYRDMLYFIKSALQDHPDEALDLAHEWAASWQDGVNNPNIVDADYRRAKGPFKSGAPGLYKLAEEVSGGAFKLADEAVAKWFDPTIDEALFPSDPIDVSTTPRFRFLSFNEAADGAIADVATPLIKGLLDQGAMSVMYGDSNTGKTFTAMDMGFHIGAGMPYAGMKVRGGLVIYVAAEGGKGARKRLAALREKYREQAPDVKFVLLASPVNLRDPKADLQPLILAIASLVAEHGGAQPVLIQLDTLSRVMSGGDENSSVDMGLLVRHMDALRAATGAHLMVVHHTGKERAKGARGHSLLRAATDTEIEIAEGQIVVTKQRDLDKSWRSGFQLEVRVLGVDADGDPVTSCTVKLIGSEAAQAGTATAVERAVLDALEVIEATSVNGAAGVSTTDLQAYFADNKSSMTAEQLRFHLRNLSAKSLVERPKRGFWAKKAEGNASSVSVCIADVFEQTEGNGGQTEGTLFD